VQRQLFLMTRFCKQHTLKFAALNIFIGHNDSWQSFIGCLFGQVSLGFCKHSGYQQLMLHASLCSLSQGRIWPVPGTWVWSLLPVL
jgi:hypothetical protein